MSKKKPIRLSQTISPFGPGAIYDVLGESFVACDTTSWGSRGEPVHLARLSRSLQVSSFRHAPVQPDTPGRAQGAGIPFLRFPEWMFCSRCRRMTRLKVDYAVKTPCCRTCQGGPRLVPMRFVQICTNGHLGDVDWWWWAHSHGGQGCVHRREELRFVVNKSGGGGLGSLVVKAACGASRSLDRITGQDTLRQVGQRCTGGQPWQRGTSECDATPQVVQRGASNLHYVRVSSALDIPPESNKRNGLSVDKQVELSAYFPKALSAVNDNGIIGPIGMNVVEIIADELSADRSTVEDAILNAWRKKVGLTTDAPDTPLDIEFGEYLAFITPRDDQHDDDDFITNHTELGEEDDGVAPAIAAALNAAVRHVVQATRLREVRAMTGFSRLHPGGEEITVVSPSLGRPMDWLPAIEVFGEGIFLGFRESTVAAWESRPDVARRVRETRQRCDASGIEWLPVPTARFIALHTLAHLLIRQLTFECGYSSASLRERIYARSADEGEPMAGILIYTAAGDTEGSMGGLVRQANPPRLTRSIAAAIAGAAWCSSDPVCSELRTGSASLNLGACHACSLVAETSCTSSNLLLDRTLLTGSEGVEGLLGSLAKAVLDEAAPLRGEQ